VEVEPTGQRGHAEVAETLTKPSPAPFQKHSPSVCTIDMSPCRIAIGSAEGPGHIVSFLDTLLVNL